MGSRGVDRLCRGRCRSPRRTRRPSTPPPFRPEVTQQHGYFHSGATSAVVDSAGGYAALTLFPEGSEVLTVEYKISLLSPAVGDRIEAVGSVLRPGRTLTVCLLEAFGVRADGTRKLVASGQQTLIRVDAPER